MPRPRNIIRTIPVHLLMPEPLMARVYGRLVSDIEGKIPYGAQQTFFVAAVEALLNHLDTEEANGASLQHPTPAA